MQKFEHRKEKLYTSELNEVDLIDAKNPQLCAEYASEIYENMKQSESFTMPSNHYMEH